MGKATLSYAMLAFLVWAAELSDGCLQGDPFADT